MDFSNKVKIAVQRAGGPTKVSIKFGVSGSAVFSWIRKRNVPDIQRAEKLAEWAGMNVRDLRPCR